jgi:hypothetical protein
MDYGFPVFAASKKGVLKWSSSSGVPQIGVRIFQTACQQLDSLKYGVVFLIFRFFGIQK